MFLTIAGNKAAGELAKVQSAIGAREAVFPYEYLWWFLIGLVFIILFSTSYTLVRRRRNSLIFRGWASIAEPHQVATIFKRAVARQADCTMEIFDHQHTNVYRGKIFEAEAGGHITLELSHLPGADVDFEGFPAQVHLNFRPDPKEAMEHYQFSSHTLAINFQKERSWRVARVALAWPQSVISAQRRDFLRLEPTGDHTLKVLLRDAPQNVPQDFDKLTPVLGEGTVMDLSMGGAQILFPGILAAQECQKYLISFDLPLSGIDIELKETHLHLVFSPLTREVLESGSEVASKNQAPRTVLRGSFSGRYRFLPESNSWVYVDFSVDAFNDLALWIHAYQRYLLKIERGLTNVTFDRHNLYPPEPPERPPVT